MNVYIQLLYYSIAVTSQNLNEGYEQIVLSMLTIRLGVDILGAFENVV